MAKVLDHGYVELVTHLGSDEQIIEAARMSTGKGFLGWGPHLRCCECKCLWKDNQDGSVSLADEDQRPCPVCEARTDETTCERVPGDEKLLAYLWKNKHATPFEMATMVIEVKAPIFVFREWHRHRTQSYNEMSARYIPMPYENYIPTMDRLFLSGGKNKQAGKKEGAEELHPDYAEVWLNQLKYVYELIEDVYQSGLNIGVPKELARLPIPVARYSRMRASANLRNWLAFLTLRMDPAAQWEIREYANAVGQIIAQLYPRTWELFIEGRKV